MKRSTAFFLLGFLMIFAGMLTLIVGSMGASSGYGVAVAVFPFPFVFVAGRPEGMAYLAAMAGITFFVIVLVIYVIMFLIILRESRRATTPSST